MQRALTVAPRFAWQPERLGRSSRSNRRTANPSEEAGAAESWRYQDRGHFRHGEGGRRRGGAGVAQSGTQSAAEGGQKAARGQLEGSQPSSAWRQRMSGGRTLATRCGTFSVTNTLPSTSRHWKELSGRMHLVNRACAVHVPCVHRMHVRCMCGAVVCIERMRCRALRTLLR